MSKGFRSTIVVVCSVLSMPAGLLALLPLLMGTFDGCDRQTAAACTVEHVGSALMIPIYGFAWFAYFEMVWQWAADRRASRRLAIAGTAAALAYPLAYWALMGGPPLSFFLLMPVLPAVLLACYVACFHFLAPPHASELRDAPSFAQDDDT